jgi:lysophospholipase L1-like esterase
MKLTYLALALSILAAPQKPITIYLAGDSTMAPKEAKARPETGWGERLQQHFDSTQVRIDNRARNGRSSKSFITEGLWKRIADSLETGDYVFIQFGHNDESPDKGPERYTTPSEFRANLLRMIADVRARNANPVLLTSVARRKFDKTGKTVDTHGEYPAVVRALAAEQHVPLLELLASTDSLLARFGPDSSRALFNQLKPGENANYPAGVEDNTHFSPRGAELVADLAVRAIRFANLPVASLLRPAATR